MNAPMQNLVEVKGVKFKFVEQTIFEEVSFNLKPRETLVIMGQSGCGKSTLLRLLLGVIKVDAGSIRFKGEEITTLSRQDLNRLRVSIGMVYQDAALIGSMSVKDNVSLPLRELSKKTPQEIDRIVDQKLEMVGLQETKEKMPSELSGGMRRRVGLARALALDPELVLFDEPSAGLDPINAVLINDLIVDLREKHQVTSMVVTHEMNSAFAVATRMVMLDGGRIVEDGPPAEFRQSRNPFVHKFLSAYSAPTEEK